MISSSRPELSVVAPAHNERDNLAPLVDELLRVLTPLRRSFEIIIVDDGSFDGSDEVLRELVSVHPAVRAIMLRDTPHRRGHGQSAAFAAGFRAARGGVIATLDADLQNDPADFPAMLALLEEEDLDFVQGDRTGSRKDTAVRKATSVVSKWLRRVLLRDTVRDCGCSMRIMRRDVAMRFPLEYRGMHRYLPILACDMGLRVREVPVGHRPRVAGVAKYGIVNRAIPGLFDCYAVRWMRSRRRPIVGDEILPPHTTGQMDARSGAMSGEAVEEVPSTHQEVQRS